MESLYKLVKNSTKSEKRYFKLQMGSEETKYRFLFTVLDGLEKLDKKVLLQKLALSQQYNFKYLMVDVKYLHKKLLLSLKAYSLNHSASFKIRDKLDSVEILFSKGMFLAAKKQVNTCKKIIIRHELFGFIFELSKWEYKIIGNLTSVVDVLERSKENSLLQNYWMQLEHLNRLYFECNLLRKTWPHSQLRYAQIIESNPLLNQNIAQTFRAKIRLLQIHQLFYFLNGNKIKELYLLDNINQIIDKDFSEFKEEDTYDYIKLFSRYLYLYLSLYPDKIKVTSQQFLSLPGKYSPQNEQLSAFVSIYLINFILSYYIDQKSYRMASQFLNNLSLDLSYYRHKTNQSFLVGTIYKSAYVYFCDGDYEKGLDNINIIVNTSFIDEQSDVVEFSSLLNLLLHYEMGNFQLVCNLLSPTHKYFKRSKIFKNDFSEIFKLLKDFCAFGSNLPPDIIAEYLNSLNTKHQGLVSTIEKYFAISDWLNAKLLSQSSMTRNLDSKQLINFSEFNIHFEK
jgi:hypothetical protein